MCVFHYLSRSIFFTISFVEVVEACLQYTRSTITHGFGVCCAKSLSVSICAEKWL